MENKYNVGEPVCVYAWINSISDEEGKLVYGITIKDINGEKSALVFGLSEDLITTVF